MTCLFSILTNRKKLITLRAAMGDELFIYASPLLFEDSIKKIDVIVEEKYQTKVLFPNDTLRPGFRYFFRYIFYGKPV